MVTSVVPDQRPRRGSPLELALYSFKQHVMSTALARSSERVRRSRTPIQAQHVADAVADIIDGVIGYELGRLRSLAEGRSDWAAGLYETTRNRGLIGKLGLRQRAVVITAVSSGHISFEQVRLYLAGEFATIPPQLHQPTYGVGSPYSLPALEAWCRQQLVADAAADAADSRPRRSARRSA